MATRKRKLDNYFTQSIQSHGKKQALELGELLKSLPTEMINNILEFLWWSEPCVLCASRCRTQMYVKRSSIFDSYGDQRDCIGSRLIRLCKRLCCVCAFQSRNQYMYRLNHESESTFAFGHIRDLSLTIKIRDHFKRKKKGTGSLGERYHTLGSKVQEYQQKMIDFILGKSNEKLWEHRITGNKE